MPVSFYLYPMSIASAIVWISLSVLAYTYLVYPLLMAGLATLLRKKNDETPSQWPAFSLIIPAYNEKGVLHEKICNTLALDYPPDCMEILLVTDGSTDQANIMDWGHRVRVLHEPERRGKAAAIHRALSFAQHPFILLTDANTLLTPNVLQAFAKSFTKQHIAAVSGEKKVNMDGHSAQAHEGVYWQYESKVKHWEAKVYTLTGAAGELMAFRRTAYTPIPEDSILDDLAMSVQFLKNGARMAYAPEACAIESPSPDVQSEFERKIRIAAGVFQAIPRMTSIWSPWPYPMRAFQFISHRLLRWIAAPVAVWTGPIALGFCFADNLALSLMAWLWAGFLLLAVIGWFSRNAKIPIPGFYVPFYFMMMHAAFPLGFWRFLRKKQTVLWTKIARS
jgi:biofilm PGA synthesis N-glycosyltransferase PgaC